jgi:hypothetical protein
MRWTLGVLWWLDGFSETWTDLCPAVNPYATATKTPAATIAKSIFFAMVLVV